MRILANQKTRHLFCWILLLITLSYSFSIVVVGLQWNGAVLYLFTSAICMGSLILTVLYLYFREQDQMIEHAVMQILESLSGNQNARIDCDDEGELYRLFHEINSLVAILNTHIENEKNTKYFLKDTISNISHQLKTPLTTLNIYNGLLQEEAQNSPAIQEFIHLSEQELDRIESLVQTLLKIAKLDSGTMVLEKTVENLSDMMDCIEQHFSYQAKQEKKQLILCRNDSVMLSCDRVWLIEAISNLVKNAFDHTKAGNTISIEWKTFASIVQITIKDNGSGIHAEDIPHIFKRFYRSRFSKDTQGIGLGLPLVKMIVEAHNGTIEVDSEWGVGTTFVMNFLIPTKL